MKAGQRRRPTAAFLIFLNSKFGVGGALRPAVRTTVDAAGDRRLIRGVLMTLSHQPNVGTFVLPLLKNENAS